jgi:NAD(P)-dependent dehydrogenase (short-subunit alcohol dehydrogenase family)
VHKSTSGALGTAEILARNRLTEAPLDSVHARPKVASKTAVRLMTKTVAVQHANHHGIRANSVPPGSMPPMRASGRTADPAIRADRMRFIPMRRPGEVDEVANAILFLASDESSYITGSEIHVDGGAIAI